jgi:hypothetical protein
MINRLDSMCVAAMSLCMIVSIVTRKRGDGRYYFALWQTNNNTPNKLLLSESAVNCQVRFVLDEHAELDLYSASALKQQSAGRNVTPFGHIILITSQPVFALSP